MDNSSIKNNIRNFRKLRNITQEDMALRMDISLTTYKALENGRTSIINKHIQQIAEIFETNIEELLLGYCPSQMTSPTLEDVRHEYGGQINLLQTRISDLEKLVHSHEETIRSKNEIIEMLRKSLGEEK